jgi:hypothetical protein
MPSRVDASGGGGGGGLFYPVAMVVVAEVVELVDVVDVVVDIAVPGVAVDVGVGVDDRALGLPRSDHVCLCSTRGPCKGSPLDLVAIGGVEGGSDAVGRVSKSTLKFGQRGGGNEVRFINIYSQYFSFYCSIVSPAINCS